MRLNTNNRWLQAAACASILAAGVLTYSPEAEACGGFFCDNSQPVNQTAERIIFSDNADDTVTALVQIMYQGPSEEFAWVLPVPGTPDVGVSSDTAFDRLQQATNPNYRMNTTVEGECGTRSNFGADDMASSGGAVNNASAPEDQDDGVDVVDSGRVGPYIHTTISVDPSSDDPADVAVDWLERNSYDVSALGADVIRPYLEDGMNLIAFKLTKEASAGDIRPVKLNYSAELPMIPIKLTAVAANDDMGVMVWVLSEERAIPSNYKSLEPNETLINWFNPGSSYEDVINQAADEADGQGFVTELAWPTTSALDSPNQQGSGARLDTAVFTEQDASEWDQLSQADWSDHHGQLVELSQRFAAWDGYLEVIDSHVPLPAGVSAEEFASCVNCYSQITGASQLEGFDPQTFVDQLEAEVIEPVQETQALVNSRPYVTRMYTTMSAADMTLDPIFDFNDSLGDHSNVHVAERVIECSPEFTRDEAPWRAELPGGSTVFGTDNSWPFSVDDDEMPANRTIVRENTSGDGEVVVDNSGEIDGLINRHNAGITDRVSGGCQVAQPAGATLARNVALALMFGAFGLLLMRTRRRQ
ncbi:MAG: DUF2330 domain-containing protein [Persicimonas sp.]